MNANHNFISAVFVEKGSLLLEIMVKTLASKADHPVGLI
jgi:hypothetical protein